MDNNIDNQEFITLLNNITDNDKQLIFELLSEMSYTNSDLTLDQLIDNCKRGNWKSAHGNIEIKAAQQYRARVMMAMYYVQTFQVRKWNQSDYKYAGQGFLKSFKENWVPYLNEVADKLKLSENEILCVAHLYLRYFIPMAEQFTNLSVKELLDSRSFSSQNFEAELKASTFKISKVKDLAKLYMMQRFQSRMNLGNSFSPQKQDFKKQVWRNILATEEMSKSKIDRMQNAPRKGFTGNDIELRFSVRLDNSLPIPGKENDSILTAYEMLNHDKNYNEVMDVTGLTFSEVRIIDCFTLIHTDKEDKN